MSLYCLGDQNHLSNFRFAQARKEAHPRRRHVALDCEALTEDAEPTHTVPTANNLKNATMQAMIRVESGEQITLDGDL